MGAESCTARSKKREKRPRSHGEAQEAMPEHQELIPGLPDDVAVDCLARVPHAAHRALCRVSRRWSSTAAAAAFGAARAAAGAAEDIVFLVQSAADSTEPPKEGDTTPPAYGVAVYNATTGEWLGRAAASPVPVFAQCAAAGRRLVLLGGWDPRSLEPVADVRLYDAATGAWRRGKPMSSARSFFACASAGGGGGGKVYVAGGHDAQKNALKTAEVYDADADVWTPLPDMAEERDECAGALVAGGRFLAVSGYRTARQGCFEPDAEWYDEENNAWHKLDQLWPPLAAGEGEEAASAGGAASCVVVGGRVWSVEGGGRGVMEWEGEGAAWRKVAPAPPGLKRGTSRAAAAPGGERVFVTGAVDAAVGRGGGGGHGVWVLDVGRKVWSFVEPPVEFSGFVFSLAAIRL